MRKDIKEIVESFDYATVQKTMEFLDWTWCDSEYGVEVPTVGRLVTSSMDLMEKAIKGNTTYACGGFVASYIDGVLELSFSLESAISKTEGV